MLVKTLLFCFAISITAQIKPSWLIQNLVKQTEHKISRENKEAEIIIEQILSCPAWDEIDRGDIKKVERKILKCLALVSNNDITATREAIRLLIQKDPHTTSLWSRVFLLNRYLFQIPEKSPIDGNLFGGWAGTPIENGIVNRLWPFSYDSQNNLKLTGEFEGYFGDGYRGLEEFDYFQKKFGLRKK